MINDRYETDVISKWANRGGLPDYPTAPSRVGVRNDRVGAKSEAPNLATELPLSADSARSLIRAGSPSVNPLETFVTARPSEPRRRKADDQISGDRGITISARKIALRWRGSL